MNEVKTAHLGLTILLRHFMMQLLDSLLTCLVPYRMSRNY